MQVGSKTDYFKLRFFTKAEGEMLNCFWKFAEKYEDDANPTMSATSFTLNLPEARSSAALLSRLRRMYSLIFRPVLLLIL